MQSDADIIVTLLYCHTVTGRLQVQQNPCGHSCTLHYHINDNKLRNCNVNKQQSVINKLLPYKVCKNCWSQSRHSPSNSCSVNPIDTTLRGKELWSDNGPSLWVQNSSRNPLWRAESSSTAFDSITDHVHWFRWRHNFCVHKTSRRHGANMWDELISQFSAVLLGKSLSDSSVYELNYCLAGIFA